MEKIHVSVSFSVCCNSEGLKTEHRSSKDPSELLSKFIDGLMEMAKKKYEACVERYEHFYYDGWFIGTKKIENKIN